MLIKSLESLFLSGVGSTLTVPAWLFHLQGLVKGLQALLFINLKMQVSDLPVQFG